MRTWLNTRHEPSLDELLGDDMMGAVMRSAGVDRAGLRRSLEELARRLPPEALTRRCGCSGERGCRPSAG
jgi:hypothetical protein